MRILLSLILASTLSALSAQNLQTAFEKSNGERTFTYQEGIQFCKALDSISEYFTLLEYGKTDAGLPLHLLVFDSDKNFDPSTTKEVFLINNAIHPGEPDGVEASLMFARDLAYNSKLRAEYRNVRLLIIPFYNIGGVLNRNTHSRANQIGPEEYGFRGNAKNLDLNRDFIKADAQNTFAFYQIFHTWKPHVFVDTHVSNGADYQYTMTLISTQEEKFGPNASVFLEEKFLPAIYQCMKKRQQEMIPYVNVHGTSPDAGINAFMESPRYSNGYTSLFDCYSFVSETHMLKPYKQRVVATRELLEQMMRLCAEYLPSTVLNKDRMIRNSFRNEARSTPIPFAWTPIFPCDSISFKGYAAKYKPSEVSGIDRLYYDRSAPYEKFIPYCHEFKASTTGRSVRAYIIPQAWQSVITRLAANGVYMDTLTREDSLWVEAARIDSYHTTKDAYEGHYLHSQTKVTWEQTKIKVRKGDVLVIPDARNELFLAHVLQPEAPDSYFNWNFFDPILQQKEWFSSYVFEDIAAEMLRKDPKLKAELEAKKATEPEFAASAFEQLYFIYKRSPYFEPSYMRYPVYVLPF